MSYISLFRKYRSENFEDLVGQEHIVRTLSNAINSGKIPQGYLFCGTRGTGKTTVARIIAKALNCVKGPTSEPCGVCDACVSIKNGTSVDVYEMDAASNRGVDDVEAIVDSVKYRPSSFRYKVYIIDEAHQLSNQAKDAFLKTLEEPPPYAVFILATTEAHKIPVTIRSRCQQFDFRRGSLEDISGRVALVAEKEGIEIDRDAVTLIARAASGSYRDSLSILEQIISFTGNKISYKDVTGVLGLIEEDLLFDISSAVYTENISDAFKYSNELISKGKDIKDAISSVAGFYRDLLAVKIGADKSRSARWVQEAEKYSDYELVRVMEAFLDSEKNIRFTGDVKLVFELAFVKACIKNKPVQIQTQNVPYRQAPEATGTQNNTLSKEITTEKKEPVRIIQSKKIEPSDDKKRIDNNETAITEEQKALIDINNFKQNWRKILEYLRQGHKKAQLSACAMEGFPTSYDDGVLTVTFRHDKEYHKQVCENEKKTLETVLRECYKVPIRLVLVMHSAPEVKVTNYEEESIKEQEKTPPPDLSKAVKKIESTLAENTESPVIKTDNSEEVRLSEMSEDNPSITSYEINHSSADDSILMDKPLLNSENGILDEEENPSENISFDNPANSVVLVNEEEQTYIPNDDFSEGSEQSLKEESKTSLKEEVSEAYDFEKSINHSFEEEIFESDDKDDLAEFHGDAFLENISIAENNKEEEYINPLDNPKYDDHPLLKDAMKAFPDAGVETIDK